MGRNLKLFALALAMCVVLFGAMQDYANGSSYLTPSSTAPWPEKSVKKIVFNGSVTTIGNYAFQGCVYRK